jgi:hypothetical protein
MAERGLRSIDRRSLISDLATALRVSETELTGGPHLGRDLVQSAPHSAIPALRVALEANNLADPADVRARPVADLAGELTAVRAAYFERCDYVSAGGRLPAVLDELHVRACPTAAEEDREVALGLLVEAGRIAASFVKGLGTWIWRMSRRCARMRPPGCSATRSRSAKPRSRGSTARRRVCGPGIGRWP